MLTTTDTGKLLKLVTAVTPMTMEAHLPPVWHAALGRVLDSYAEGEAAVVALIQRQTFVSPSEIIAEAKAQRKARLAEAERSTPRQDAIGAVVPVYWPGHPQEGERIDPDDVANFQEAKRRQCYGVATGRGPVVDRSREIATITGSAARTIGGRA